MADGCCAVALDSNRWQHGKLQDIDVLVVLFAHSRSAHVLLRISFPSLQIRQNTLCSILRVHFVFLLPSI